MEVCPQLAKTQSETSQALGKHKAKLSALRATKLKKSPPPCPCAWPRAGPQGPPLENSELVSAWQGTQGYG